jgi:phosphoserine phosphatase
MQSLALFDLDHTLLPIDSEYEWGRFLVAQGAVDREAFEQANDRWMREYREGTLDFARHARFSLGLLAQHPRTRLDAWRATFMREVIQLDAVELADLNARKRQRHLDGHALQLLKHRHFQPPQFLVGDDEEISRATGRVENPQPIDAGK